MKPFLLNSRETVFLMIDLQERLLPFISGSQNIINNAIKLIRTSKVLDIPLKYTEQYPKGLGHTVIELCSEFPEEALRFEKSHFACFHEDKFDEFFHESRKPQVVVFGIESHICLLSTVFQLLERNYLVAVASDACGSRATQNHNSALQTISAAGALILPTESVIYQLLKRAGTPEFKQLLPLFKERHLQNND